jgi:hypothetical protein
MEHAINDDKAPVVMNVKLQVGKNPLGVPHGTLMDVQIVITDEYEVIRTSSAKFTQDLVRAEKLKPTAQGTIAKYSERLQKAIIKFPGRSKAEISKIVAEDLKKLGVV